MSIGIERVLAIITRTLSKKIDTVYRECFVFSFLENPITGWLKLMEYWQGVSMMSHWGPGIRIKFKVYNTKDHYNTRKENPEFGKWGINNIVTMNMSQLHDSRQKNRWLSAKLRYLHC